MKRSELILLIVVATAFLISCYYALKFADRWLIIDAMPIERRQQLESRD